MAKRNAPLDDLSRYGRLAEYNRKRRFDVTPEPPGRAGKKKATRALEFVVSLRGRHSIRACGGWR